jgi:hypothetical protein
VQTPAGFYAEAAGEDAPCQVTERAGRTVHSAHARTAADSSKTLSLTPVLLPHGTARPTGRGCRKTAVFLQRMIPSWRRAGAGGSSLCTCTYDVRVGAVRQSRALTDDGSISGRKLGVGCHPWARTAAAAAASEGSPEAVWRASPAHLHRARRDVW